MEGERASAELAQVRKPLPRPQQGTWTPGASSTPPSWGPPWVARLPHPSQSTFHGDGNRIHGFSSSTQGLVPRGGMKPKGRLGEPPRARPLSLADLRRGGLGWPQEREVSEFRLLGCQSHRILDRSGGQALGPCPGTHGDTRWPDCPGPHRHLCQCKTRTRSLTLCLLPWAQRWETPKAGEGEEKTGWGSSPNFRPALQLRGWGWEQRGLGMFPPETGKAEARQRSRPLGWWEWGTRWDRDRPFAPGQDPVFSPPPRSGALTALPPPDNQRWITVPIVQRGQVRPGRNVHSEAHGGREDSASLILPAPPLSGVGVPLPPKACAFPSCSVWEVGLTFRGKEERQGSTQSEGGYPAVPSLPHSSTFPRVVRG